MDRKLLEAAHDRLASDLAKQYGEGEESKEGNMVRAEVSFDGLSGGVKYAEPEVRVPVSKPKRKKRKSRKGAKQSSAL